MGSLGVAGYQVSLVPSLECLPVPFVPVGGALFGLPHRGGAHLLGPLDVSLVVLAAALCLFPLLPLSQHCRIIVLRAIESTQL